MENVKSRLIVGFLVCRSCRTVLHGCSPIENTEKEKQRMLQKAPRSWVGPIFVGSPFGYFHSVQACDSKGICKDRFAGVEVIWEETDEINEETGNYRFNR